MGESHLPHSGGLLYLLPNMYLHGGVNAVACQVLNDCYQCLVSFSLLLSFGFHSKMCSYCISSTDE